MRISDWSSDVCSSDLQARNIHVRMLPGIGQLIDGHFAVNDIRDVQVEDLLGRDAVAPNELLMGRSLLSKNVLVTGAGGSIGSELCRQIIRSRPKRLILVDQTDYFARKSGVEGKRGAVRVNL